MLSISCDTMEVKSNLRLKKDELPNGIKPFYSCDNNDLWRYHINLGKMEVATIAQAIENVREVFAAAQTLIAVRVDLKFDDDKTPFHEKYKLHRLLMSLAAVKHGITNIYMDTDFITGELISVKFDTDTREAQYYNKERQKRGSGSELKTIGRFEVRSKKLSDVNLFEPQDGLAVSLIEKWLDYFHKAATPKTFSTLKARLNETIIGKYDGSTITSFLARFKDDMIYDRTQIKDLFSQLGQIKNGNDKSADVQTSRFLSNNKDFEVIDLDRIKRYLDELKAIVASATEI